MNKQIIIVRTKAGHLYASYIAKEIEHFGIKCAILDYECLESYLRENQCSSENTLLHFRTAGPHINTKAFALEKLGYRCINSPKVLDRTSDKYKSCEWAHEQGIILPLTKKGTREFIKKATESLSFKNFVLKPINSVNQGALCFRSFVGDLEIDEKLSQVPGEEVILQEFVEYLKIYRVVVIQGKALNKAVFYDEPNAKRWKVSVCLNPEMKHEPQPDPQLLAYAEHLANVFESEVAFIDVFETKKGYILSEINTACNLKQHEEKSGYNISKDIAKYLISQL